VGKIVLELFLLLIGEFAGIGTWQKIPETQLLEERHVSQLDGVRVRSSRSSEFSRFSRRMLGLSCTLGKSK
jgi:hypothetical protein